VFVRSSEPACSRGHQSELGGRSRGVSERDHDVCRTVVVHADLDDPHSPVRPALPDLRTDPDERRGGDRDATGRGHRPARLRGGAPAESRQDEEDLSGEHRAMLPWLSS